MLIDATVRVARSLRMDTVAEGIETAGQAAVVRELGCEKGQGHMFSKPLLAADLALWLSVSATDGATEGGAASAFANTAAEAALSRLSCAPAA